jgi:hypothetical protein
MQITLPPKESLKNISPNCLKVERATNFLPSVSLRAERLAIVRVKTLTIVIAQNHVIDRNRTISHKPAVTKVELCTKALTGVGAAIAAGSHLVKGAWALLVKERTTKSKRVKILKKLKLKKSPFLKSQ